FFLKWPERVPLPITVSFGKTMPATTTAWQMRQAILELGSEAFRHRRTPNDLLHIRFLRAARRHWHKACVADSTGVHLRYWRALGGRLAFADWSKRGRPADKRVGVTLPASVAGVLVNIAALFAGKVPVNLNFTAGPEATEAALAQCGIGTIVTSRRFIEKAKLAERPGMVFVEDIAPTLSGARKAFLAVACYLLPSGLAAKLFGLRRQQPDDVATVLFSSGSTGVPKGVLLSHHNLLSNVEAVAQILWVAPAHKMMGVLPFFPALGLTRCLWGPLLSGLGARYHPHPPDAQANRQLVGEPPAPHLLNTPTPPHPPSQPRRPPATPPCGSGSPPNSPPPATPSSAPSACPLRSPPPSRRSSESPCSRAMAARKWAPSSPSTPSTWQMGRSSRQA